MKIEIKRIREFSYEIIGFNTVFRQPLLLSILQYTPLLRSIFHVKFQLITYITSRSRRGLVGNVLAY